MVPCYNCYSDDHIASNLPLPCKKYNIKQEKNAREASLGSVSIHGKVGQRNNDRLKWERDKDKTNGGDDDVNRNDFGNGV